MSYLSYELEQNENLIKTIRKHWTVFIFPVTKSLIALIFCFLAYGIANSLPFGRDIIFAVILASIMYLVYEIWMWYLDCYIITDKKIIDIDQKGIFRRTVAEIELRDIQEAIYEVNGPLETLFGFGTVKVSTAGSGMIVMEKVPRPEDVKRLISEAEQNYKI